MTKARIAINGFGRIGRAFLKSVFDRETKPDLDIVVINDLGDLDLMIYLLKYDSVYGRWNKKIEVKEKDNEKYLVIDGKEIKFIQEKDPLKLPWKDLNIDIVVEATGVFAKFEAAKAHIDAGAKRVVITAPAKDDETEWGKTVLPGVNEEELKECLITSNGSCTTQSASPVMQVLKEAIGVKKAFLVSVHGYTATQNLVDGPTRSKDFRRARAAAVNIVPTSTGAAIAVARAVKALKFDGKALRIPTVIGSISAITFLSAIVSTDIIADYHGAIVDLNLTSVVDGDLCTVFSWYDNEAGYTETLVRHVLKLAEAI